MKPPHNEKGVTLVEVLAIFVITGVIVLLLVGLYIYTQKQFDRHRDDAHHLTDITIVISEITKDIRSEDIEEITPTKIEFTDGNKYELIEDILYKNDAPYIYDIEIFTVDMIENEVLIKIKSRTGQEIETALIVR